MSVLGGISSKCYDENYPGRRMRIAPPKGACGPCMCMTCTEYDVSHQPP